MTQLQRTRSLLVFMGTAEVMNHKHRKLRFVHQGKGPIFSIMEEHQQMSTVCADDNSTSVWYGGRAVQHTDTNIYGLTDSLIAISWLTGINKLPSKTNQQAKVRLTGGALKFNQRLWFLAELHYPVALTVKGLPVPKWITSLLSSSHQCIIKIQIDLSASEPNKHAPLKLSQTDTREPAS